MITKFPSPAISEGYSNKNNSSVEENTDIPLKDNSVNNNSNNEKESSITTPKQTGGSSDEVIIPPPGIPSSSSKKVRIFNTKIITN